MRIEKSTPAVLALALAAALPSAQASAGLAEQKQCVQCHHAGQPRAAPSFQEIAQKYKGQKDGVATMEAVIRRGSRSTGGPHWGQATMPDTAERPEVSTAEARTLAKWIASQ